MEAHPGVFVSNLATEAWDPDPEVGESHVFASVDGAYAGMTRYIHAPTPSPWAVPVRETFLILEGAARIEIADGPTIELRAGDMASLPKAP